MSALIIAAINANDDFEAARLILIETGRAASIDAKFETWRLGPITGQTIIQDWLNGYPSALEDGMARSPAPIGGEARPEPETLDAMHVVTRRGPAGRKTYFAAYGETIWTERPEDAAQFLTEEDAAATADDFGDYYGMKGAGYQLSTEPAPKKDTPT